MCVYTVYLLVQSIKTSRHMIASNVSLLHVFFFYKLHFTAEVKTELKIKPICCHSLQKNIYVDTGIDVVLDSHFLNRRR